MNITEKMKEINENISMLNTFSEKMWYLHTLLANLQENKNKCECGEIAVILHPLQVHMCEKCFKKETKGQKGWKWNGTVEKMKNNILIELSLQNAMKKWKQENPEPKRMSKEWVYWISSSVDFKNQLKEYFKNKLENK